MKRGYGRAHGKIILVGEHAVVYGQPAIALPFTAVQVEVVITPSEGNTSFLTCPIYEGPLEHLPPLLNNLHVIFEAFIKDEPLHIDIKSTILLGRGMGSSAAVAIALIRAFLMYEGLTWSPSQVRALADQAEKIAHQAASGIDTWVTSQKDALQFIKGQGIDRFNLSLPASLVIADTGIRGDTKEAVGHVAQLLQEEAGRYEPIMAAIGTLVREVRGAIEDKNLRQLGRLLTCNHNYLRDLHVSHPKLDAFVEVALRAGAYGAKMTGGGLGGCMLALTTEPIEVCEALKEAGAGKTWILPLADTF